MLVNVAVSQFSTLLMARACEGEFHALTGKPNTALPDFASHDAAELNILGRGKNA